MKHPHGAVKEAWSCRRDLHAARFNLEKVAPLDDESKKLIEGAVTRLGLSARAFNKVLRVARTLADLEGEESVRASHVGEAIQGRILDRSERR